MKEATVEYLPRDQFQPFHRRKQRWAIIVAHRRAGKTVATINDLIWLALRDNRAAAMRSWRPGQGSGLEISQTIRLDTSRGLGARALRFALHLRSEERRVGKECRS